MSNSLRTHEVRLGSIGALSYIYKGLATAEPVTFHEQYLNELLRAEYVLIVGAFDTYMKDLLLHHIDHLIPADAEDPSLARIQTEEEIHKRAYISVKTIGNTLGRLGITDCWTKISAEMGENDAEVLKSKLTAIFRRRNQIAHQTDIDEATGQLQQITVEEVDSASLFLRDVVKTIDYLVDTAYPNDDIS